VNTEQVVTDEGTGGGGPGGGGGLGGGGGAGACVVLHPVVPVHADASKHDCCTPTTSGVYVGFSYCRYEQEPQPLGRPSSLDTSTEVS
jgi:hypothetical protein